MNLTNKRNNIPMNHACLKAGVGKVDITATEGELSSYAARYDVSSVEFPQ
jgi:hypothetical protein